MHFLEDPKPSVIVTTGVPFGGADGQPLLMDIARPDPLPKALMPAVINIHGGGWVEGARGVAADSILPNHGFFYCSIDYRLAPGAIFPAQIHDCKAAVRFLRVNADEFHLDPNCIGVWGGSAGGHLAALLGTSYDISELEGESGSPGVSSRVQAVFATSCPSDLHFPDVSGVLPKLFGGPFEERQDLVRLANPITWVRPDAPPSLLVHGTEDEIVPLEQAERLYGALCHAGVSAKLVILKDADHGLSGYEDEWRHLMLAFFKRHLSWRE